MRAVIAAALAFSLEAGCEPRAWEPTSCVHVHIDRSPDIDSRLACEHDPTRHWTIRELYEDGWRMTGIYRLPGSDLANEHVVRLHFERRKDKSRSGGDASRSPG